MAQWLYSSAGQPIAFASGDAIFLRNGAFLGWLDGDGVWHGTYKGEIVDGDLLLYNLGRSSTVRGMRGLPATPALPALPGLRGSRGMPAGYKDL